MTARTRQTCAAAVVLLALVGAPAVATAQLAVHDPAVTLRNQLTAVLQEQILIVQRAQVSQLRRMAQRLSAHTALSKYAVAGAPLWRIHDFESADISPLARAVHAALNYGDPTGGAYAAAAAPLVAPEALLAARSAIARRPLASALATVEAADAAAVAAVHATGQVRLAGRRELSAIDALEAQVLDPSLEQSATAVLDKISGAVLIGTRQRQARAQLLASLLEQLLIDNKRARDTQAAALARLAATSTDGRAAREAFVTGSGDALRTWRQP